MGTNQYPKADDIKAIGNRVIVSDMEFGEQVTKGGIIIPSDDGTRGIYSQDGVKVFRKGPRTMTHEQGQWILVEHGRWTRGLSRILGDEDMTLRMVEAESIPGTMKDPIDFTDMNTVMVRRH